MNELEENILKRCLSKPRENILSKINILNQVLKIFISFKMNIKHR